ncbi:hypothetical protein BCAH1134_C0650 (plasmid) [Bacillus cereus AH1134]|nr:hypothetical protein BCAH1134_C0650 [Bacillus cereus AH1134]
MRKNKIGFNIYQYLNAENCLRHFNQNLRGAYNEQTKKVIET